jgi:hypothetical protein
LDDALKDGAGLGDSVRPERFEIGSAADEGTVWRQQRVDRGIIGTRGRPAHGRRKPVAAPCEGLDVRGAIILLAKGPPQAGDGLLEAVVSDGDILPRCLDQRLLRQHSARIGDQRRQDRNVAVRKGDRLGPAQQPPRTRVEMKWAEGKDRAGRHAGWPC